MLSVPSIYRPTRCSPLASVCGLAGVALLVTVLLISSQPAVATSAHVAVKADSQSAGALADKAVAALDDTHHEVLGDALRCFRVRGGGSECGFAVVIQYDDGAVRTCAGSLVVRRHHARFRSGLSCRLSGSGQVRKPLGATRLPYDP